MPAFVDVIFFGQFICFILFGVVCTVQYFSAGYMGEPDDDKQSVKKKPEYKTKWAQYSFAYAVLSVTAKTILEIGFLGLVATSPEYLKPRLAPKATVTRYSSVAQVSLLNNRTVSVPANTTCYSIGTGR
jgi:putative lipase involved disintegration of autophagic bodies